MQKIRRNILLLATIALTCMPAVYARPSAEIEMPTNEPPELTVVSGLAYSHSPQYKKEFSTAVASAKKFCRQYKRQHPDARNLAIVSDIDETIVDNREAFVAHPDKFVWEEFEKWLKQARAPALKETAEFLKWARKEGFAILLVTGRPEVDRVYTIENLIHDGIAYDGLYMRPSMSDTVPAYKASEFKAGVRKSLEDMGFVVVVDIGDQYSDLIGGHSLDCEKLPNKIYFLK